MNTPLPKPSITLASRSPRRVRLLREAGYEPEVVVPGVDDSRLIIGRAPARWIAAALAYFKAIGAIELADAAGRVVLAADTFVVKGDSIIGKPRDRDDARRIINSLSGGMHRVLTGVAIVDDRATPRSRMFLVDEAEVHVGRVPEERIESYLATESWRGKAGAYNLMERIEDGWPIRWTGDATTVMGLPMQRLSPILARMTSSQRDIEPQGSGAA